MGDDEEPADNIAGGTAGGVTRGSFDTDHHETEAEAVVNRLGELYWQTTYGGQSAFVCLVRTILSQNTSDSASQPAHDALLETFGADDDALATALATATKEEIAPVIRPAGLHNQKAATLTAVAEWVQGRFGSASAFDHFVTESPPAAVRETLLEVDGIGPKTADCVLLFAGGADGVFPVDTHVHRIYRRLGIAPPEADHETVREILEQSVPPAKCGFGHTASIQFGREYCTAQSPVCLEDTDTCPLADRCQQVGLDR